MFMISVNNIKKKLILACICIGVILTLSIALPSLYYSLSSTATNSNEVLELKEPLRVQADIVESDRADWFNVFINQ